MPLDEHPDKPEAVVDAQAEAAGGPVSPVARRADDPDIALDVDRLIEQTGGRPGSFDARLVREMIQTALKLIPDGRDTGEIKLLTNSVKELRYAFRVFHKFRVPHKVTIFGSARTPEDHPDFKACVEFGRLMAEAGWMSITGAGLGIMKAGHVGPGREASFGVAIRLPFETTANSVIAGDEKLINFRYFFTRKLMFVSQAEAVALFPGGFGTLDEAYEALTLVQTGKSTPMPIVMIEGEGGDYWKSWDHWVRTQLLARGWISPEDPAIYYLAKNARDAAEHIIRFYRNYHSSRYVRDQFVIRLNRALRAEDVAKLENDFRVLLKTGGIEQVFRPLEGEDDHQQLPRLRFHHTKHKYGLVRSLIDRINSLDPA
ncbi:pyrimidine/purine-5'-nucleotide nucleosidase [Phycisphaerales bacterium]|nr:pyrimidine/purine-5'-nucleotide nucleosidase [Phycisphaerales bacterium]